MVTCNFGTSSAARDRTDRSDRTDRIDRTEIDPLREPIKLGGKAGLGRIESAELERIKHVGVSGCTSVSKTLYRSVMAASEVRAE